MMRSTVSILLLFVLYVLLVSFAVTAITVPPCYVFDMTETGFTPTHTYSELDTPSGETFVKFCLLSRPNPADTIAQSQVRDYQGSTLTTTYKRLLISITKMTGPLVGNTIYKFRIVPNEWNGVSQMGITSSGSQIHYQQDATQSSYVGVGFASSCQGIGVQSSITLTGTGYLLTPTSSQRPAYCGNPNSNPSAGVTTVTNGVPAIKTFGVTGDCKFTQYLPDGAACGVTYNDGLVGWNGNYRLEIVRSVRTQPLGVNQGTSSELQGQGDTWKSSVYNALVLMVGPIVSPSGDFKGLRYWLDGSQAPDGSWDFHNGVLPAGTFSAQFPTYGRIPAGVAFCDTTSGQDAPATIDLRAFADDTSSGQFALTAYFDPCGSNIGQSNKFLGGQFTAQQFVKLSIDGTASRVASAGCLQSNVDVNAGLGIPPVLTRVACPSNQILVTLEGSGQCISPAGCVAGTIPSYGDAVQIWSTCAGCGGGTYSGSAGASSCQQCQTGRYTNVASQTTCAACATGSAQSQTGQSTCTSCTAGRFTATTASTTCTACAVGSSSPVGATTCTLCTAGKFNNVAGGNCADCPAGKYSAVGATACLDCSAGFSSLAGSSSCTACAAGKFSSTAGSLCQSCAAGAYSNVPGVTVCTQCAAGTSVGTIGATVCSSCDYGKFASNAGQSVCSDCSAGKYGSTTGLTQCSDCDWGTISSVAGQAACEPCPSGFVSTGGTTCNPCPTNPLDMIGVGHCCANGVLTNVYDSLMVAGAVGSAIYDSYCSLGQLNKLGINPVCSTCYPPICLPSQSGVTQKLSWAVKLGSAAKNIYSSIKKLVDDNQFCNA